MIIDSFLYYNETDLFLTRIQYLAPWVEHFVVVEADHSFTMQPHAKHFDHVFDKLSPELQQKIVYDYVKIDTSEFDQLDLKNQGRAVERQSRSRALELVHGLNKPESVVAFSDGDEFWDPRMLDQAIELIDQNQRICWHQEYRVCFLEWKGRYGFWPGTKMTRVKHLPEDVMRFYVSRNKSMGEFPAHVVGGWHLTIMGNLNIKTAQISAKRETPSWEQKVNRSSQGIADAIFDNSWNQVVKKGKMKAENVGVDALDPVLVTIAKQYPDLWSNGINP
jgi:hypothetical protein